MKWYTEGDLFSVSTGKKEKEYSWPVNAMKHRDEAVGLKKL